MYGRFSDYSCSRAKLQQQGKTTVAGQNYRITASLGVLASRSGGSSAVLCGLNTETRPRLGSLQRLIVVASPTTFCFQLSVPDPSVTAPPLHLQPMAGHRTAINPLKYSFSPLTFVLLRSRLQPLSFSTLLCSRLQSLSSSFALALLCSRLQSLSSLVALILVPSHPPTFLSSSLVLLHNSTPLCCSLEHHGLRWSWPH